MILGVLASAASARADAPVSMGAQGALQRGALTMDAPKNGSAATFGSPVTDDRRMFKLRWRFPWLFASGGGGFGVGAAPLAGGFSPIAGFGGMSFAAEPMTGFSSLIPTLAVGEPHKAVSAQIGAISSSLGHGSLVDRYTNSPEGGARAFGGSLEVNLAGLGGQIMVGNAINPQSFVAARIYGRPIMWFFAPDATFQPNELDVDPRTELTGMWVTGLSGVVDADAPSVDGRITEWGASWDNEAAFFDNQLFKVIPYLDLNALGQKTGESPGAGAHPGVILMGDVAGFRADLVPELNFGTDGYVPRYFDRIYMLERGATLGLNKPKLDLDRPASWGWQLRAQGGFMEWLTMFAEARDQTPFDPTRGHSSATLTGGGAVWVLFFGGSLVASQTGITDYFDPHVGGRGFVLTGEGRVALMFNTIHVVGRAWRAHIPAGDTADDYLVNQGATLGVELNLDML